MPLKGKSQYLWLKVHKKFKCSLVIRVLGAYYLFPFLFRYLTAKDAGTGTMKPKKEELELRVAMPDAKQRGSIVRQGIIVNG